MRIEKPFLCKGRIGRESFREVLVGMMAMVLIGTLALTTAFKTSAVGQRPGKQKAIEILESRVEADKKRIKKLNLGITPEQPMIPVVGQQQPVCTSPPAGLVGWWPGDGNYKDIISGNNGTPVGGVTFSGGEVGQAFSLNGADASVKVPDIAGKLNLGSGEMTLDAWISAPPFIGGSDARTIVAKSNPSFPFQGYFLRVRGDNRVEFAATDCGTGACGFSDELGSGAPKEPVRSTSVVADGQFHHVAGIRRADGTREIWVDGHLENRRSEAMWNTDSDNPLYIGDLDGTAGIYRFVGLADEVEVFNRALSAAEIQAIFNAGSAGKCKGCQVSATALKMSDSHTLQVDVTGQFSDNPLSGKSLFVSTAIGGVSLSGELPVPSGLTGTQSQSFSVDLAAKNVPRFTDNAKFKVIAGMSENGSACSNTPQDAIVLLPLIIIPGIEILTHIDGGNGTFPELEASLESVLATTTTPFLGESYRLRSDATRYPTLYTLNYRTAVASFIEGAVDLNGLVSQVKSLTYADSVNVLTHSKGGLVAREYVSGGISGPGPIPVKRLIMCEPPNLGSLKASWDSLLLQVGLPFVHADLRNLLPVWPWERPVSFLPFRSTPNPELDRLNNKPMPTGIAYTLIYSTSQDTQWTRTGLPGAFFFSHVPGDGVVPAFSMFGLKPDPNNPGQAPILIPAFQGITINAIEIDGPHSGYLKQQAVMNRVGALLTQ